MTLETLYRKYLKLMAKNTNPYSFLELLSSEGKIPGYAANDNRPGGSFSSGIRAA